MYVRENRQKCQAHNLKVAGSNPAPAAKHDLQLLRHLFEAVFCFVSYCSVHCRFSVMWALSYKVLDYICNFGGRGFGQIERPCSVEQNCTAVERIKNKYELKIWECPNFIHMLAFHKRNSEHCLTFEQF